LQSAADDKLDKESYKSKLSTINENQPKNPTIMKQLKSDENQLIDHSDLDLLKNTITGLKSTEQQ